MRKNTKVYLTEYITGKHIYSTKDLPDLEKVVSITYVYESVSIPLKCRFYRKRQEIQIMNLPDFLENIHGYGNLRLTYQPYRASNG
jgi:hypothetical protein